MGYALGQGVKDLQTRKKKKRGILETLGRVTKNDGEEPIGNMQKRERKGEGVLLGTDYLPDKENKV